MTKKSFSATSAMLIPLALLLAQVPVEARGNNTATEDARKTLQEIQASAATVEDEADHLQMMSVSTQYSPESHIDSLMVLKDDINKMGREMSSLEAEREALAPWEQQAIDKALPLLRDTATNTDAAINYFNDNKSHLWTADYRGYADRVYQDSEQIAKTLRDYLKYAKARDQEERLHQSLGVEGN